MIGLSLRLSTSAQRKTKHDLAFINASMQMKFNGCLSSTTFASVAQSSLVAAGVPDIDTNIEGILYRSMGVGLIPPLNQATFTSRSLQNEEYWHPRGVKAERQFTSGAVIAICIKKADKADDVPDERHSFAVHDISYSKRSMMSIIDDVVIDVSRCCLFLKDIRQCTLLDANVHLVWMDYLPLLIASKNIAAGDEILMEWSRPML